MTKDILCVHLLDDFSGSAKVFATTIDILKEAGHTTQVLVGSHGQDGFIRRKHQVETFHYRFQRHKLLLLISFFYAQLVLFLRVCRILRSHPGQVVYVNTLLPMGAILAGAACNRTVVTHVHEVGMGSRLLFRLLLSIAKRFSTRFIAVSQYVLDALDLPQKSTAVIHNALDESEWQVACAIAQARATSPVSTPFRVMMACSLKWYKGVDAFVALARACRSSTEPSMRGSIFTLVLNCEQSEFNAFRQSLLPQDAVELVHRPSMIYDYYRQAHLVLNMSLPEGWVETFGLTLLEAMSCGVPVVSPTVGGCTELFEPGKGGWHIDARDVAALQTCIKTLAFDKGHWQAASMQACAASARFTPDLFAGRVAALFASL